LIDAIAEWHRIFKARDLAALDALLADQATFHSPILHTPQAGKMLTKMYLSGAFFVLGNDTFRYVREVKGDCDAVLEFVVEVDGVTINGVDMIRWNDEGRIVDFKVMLRPLKAVNLVHQKMAAALETLKRQPG
jgi:hypothetical protein